MDVPTDATFVKPAPVRILIVDDDLGNGALVERLLGVAGYVVEHAVDPLKAVPLLRGGDYALVLLDQNMPGMDGLTLLEEIRKESNVPVVMLTGSDKSALAVRAIRLGAFDYLTKPVEEPRLLQTVRQAIEADAGAGSRIAHYEVLREVGRGGMGVVFAARDPRLDRTVALKVLLPEFAADPAYELKFLGEARAAAKFSHPNIVTVYEAGRFRGRLFMAMEFVQGEPLEHFVRAGTALPLARVLDIGVQVSAALDALHEAGMMHRDLKPSNLIVTAASTVKVLDFGLVRPLELGPDHKEDVSGTLSYAPPEILNEGSADARGDIYALGVVLFELLSGTRAFESKSMTDLIHKITEGRSGKSLDELTEVPKEAVDLLRSMMALKPADRPATMGAVRASLQTLRRITGDRRASRR